MNNLFDFEPIMNPFGDLENYLVSDRSSYITESNPHSSGTGEDEMIPELKLGNLY